MENRTIDCHLGHTAMVLIVSAGSAPGIQCSSWPWVCWSSRLHLHITIALLPNRAPAELFSMGNFCPHWVVSPYYSQDGQHADKIVCDVHTRTADMDAKIKMTAHSDMCQGNIRLQLPASEKAVRAEWTKFSIPADLTSTCWSPDNRNNSRIRKDNGHSRACTLLCLNDISVLLSCQVFNS